MAIVETHLISNLAFKCQGDIGELTTYTNRNGIVVFLKAWLRDPASIKQIAHRNRIRAAAFNWKNTTPANRRAYERASKRLSLYLNGYNIWVSASMNPDARSALPTLERQAHVTLIPPTAV